MRSPVLATVRAAVKRKLLVDSIAEAGWTATMLLAGVVLLLLAGSSLFSSQWLIILLFIGIAVGAWRVYRQWMPPYRVAQIVDRRLQLRDTLSTGWYLHNNERAATNAAIAYQLQQADAVAATVKPESSFPFFGFRQWTIAGCLAVLSLGLAFARYSVAESLDLHAPLVHLTLAPVIEQAKEILGRKPNRGEQPTTWRELSSPRNSGDANGLTAENNQSKNPGPSPAAGDSGAPPASSIKAGSQAGKGESESGPQAGASDTSSQNARGQMAASASAPGQQGAAKSAGADEKKSANAAPQNGAPPLMSRMKDALSSLMAKMQPSSAASSKAGSQQQSPESKAGDQSSASAKSQAGSKLQQQQPGDQASNPSESAEGQGQGQAAEKSGAGQSKSSDQSAQAGSDAHSGVGRQDGDKAIRDAEQLRAVGKLADIIGRRSAELTGDATVETSSSKQQLKTEYTRRLGQHSDQGGEINREVVPLQYQRYVKDYMEAVRKHDKGSQ